MARYLIHIGYHKTGTTWLQRHYFSRRDAGFAFMREKDGAVPEGIGGRTPGRFLLEQPLFHYDPAASRAALDAFFAKDIAGGLQPVISSEELSGNPISGGWKSKELAWRLAAAFPDARILIVVREQVSMIRACYMQYLRAGGGMSLRDFMVGPQDYNAPLPDLYYYRYDHLVAHYRDLFGAQNVLCLPYELFLRDGAGYIERIRAFAGASPVADLPLDQRENAGRQMLQYPVWRWINPLVKRDSANGRSPWAVNWLRRPARFALRNATRLAPAAWHDGLTRRWERCIRQETEGFFEESNRRLAALCGHDLGALGWPV